MLSLEDVLREASRDGRVCPMPMKWNRLWEMLPDRRRVGGGWEPPAPLILAAWWVADDDKKRECFHLHIRWADEHGVLDKVAKLIYGLTEHDWYTGN